MADPVSWLQIEQGWSVIASDGGVVGTVAQVEGDKQSDIFDGLAVAGTDSSQIHYVPGELVGAIFPGEVHLQIALAGTATLARFEPSAGEAPLRLDEPSLAARLSRWLSGKR